MQIHTKHWFTGVTLLLCLVSLLVGWLVCSPWPVAAGGVGLCYLALRIAYFGREEKEPAR